ncbi:protein of unknown function [Thauera humireducens]|nr:protein of unknown function [Thauera humireducens]
MLPTLSPSSICGPAGNSVHVTFTPSAFRRASRLPRAFTIESVEPFCQPMRISGVLASAAGVESAIGAAAAASSPLRTERRERALDEVDMIGLLMCVAEGGPWPTGPWARLSERIRRRVQPAIEPRKTALLIDGLVESFADSGLWPLANAIARHFGARVRTAGQTHSRKYPWRISWAVSCWRPR